MSAYANWNNALEAVERAEALNPISHRAIQDAQEIARVMYLRWRAEKSGDPTTAADLRRAEVTARGHGLAV